MVILTLPVKLPPKKYLTRLVWSTKHRLIASRADEMQDLGWAAGVVGETPNNPELAQDPGSHGCLCVAAGLTAIILITCVGRELST